MDAQASLADFTNRLPRIVPLLSVAWRLRAATMLLVPAALWAWLCWDWPMRLGFYADDWNILLHPSIGTADAFQDIARVVSSRPVSIPFIWLFQVIVDWSPSRSQFLNAAMLLVTAASIGMLAAALASVVHRLRGGAAWVGACVASAAFVVFPSTVGTFAWCIGGTTAVPAIPLFCFGMALLLHSAGSPWRLGLGLLLALLSHLSYEAFYFQEITFILLAAALRADGPKNIPWRALTGAVIVNIGCIAFNRLVPGGIHKTFDWNFLHLLLASHARIILVFWHATREHANLIGTSGLIATLSGATCLASVVGLVRVMVAFLVMVCGILAASLLYSFAGYGLGAEGPGARVSIVIATYSSVGAGLLATAVWRQADCRKFSAAAFCLSAAATLVALDLIGRLRVSEWAATWTYETERLSRLPAGMENPDYARRIYFAIDDRRSWPSGVDPANAPWEITGAVAWASYKVTGRRSLMIHVWREGRSNWFSTPRNWFSRWNGQQFEQGPCSSNVVVYSLSGSELWLWQTSAAELTRAEAPWQQACQ
jgi:hypothetical protein